jgi:hypothetical protein
MPEILSLNINSSKEDCMNQYKQFMEIMLLKIRDRYQEFEMEVDQLHKYIETNRDRWKISLAKQMEIQVGCVLEIQLQKSEIDGPKINEARNELIRIKNFCHLINNQPLFSVTSPEDNQVHPNTSQLAFPTLIKDGLKSMEEFVMEDTSEVPEQPGQHQAHIEKQTIHRKPDGAYH